MKIIGIDTETTNGLTDENGKLDLSQSLVYDVGWQIVNEETGKIYKKRSFVVAEIFLDKELMSLALYKDKIPQYWEDIKKGKRILATFSRIHRKFLKDCKNYNVHAVFAHNAFFDYRALNNTLRFLSGSKYRYFYPYKIEIWDTLLMSRQVFNREEKYTTFCFEHNFLTNHKYPQNKLTAEVLYRYLKGDENFNESHTGLEDVEIETEILLYCLKNGEGIRKALFKKKRASELSENAAGLNERP